MPVLFQDARSTSRSAGSEGAFGPTPVDVETLVSEVRERLCLKNHERYFPGKRAMPYQRSSACNLCRCANKHFSSPVMIQSQQRFKHRTVDHCLSCSSCSKLKKPSSLQNVEDARNMLEKLLSEQSLIQEAVRRLQAQRSKTNCAKETLFQFDNEDSSDTASGFTPLFSESEDDALSQHSVDL